MPRYAEVSEQLLIEEFQDMVALGREIREACLHRDLSAADRRIIIGEDTLVRMLRGLAVNQRNKLTLIKIH